MGIFKRTRSRTPREIMDGPSDTGEGGTDRLDRIEKQCPSRHESTGFEQWATPDDFGFLVEFALAAHELDRTEQAFACDVYSQDAGRAAVLMAQHLPREVVQKVPGYPQVRALRQACPSCRSGERHISCHDDVENPRNYGERRTQGINRLQSATANSDWVGALGALADLEAIEVQGPSDFIEFWRWRSNYVLLATDKGYTDRAKDRALDALRLRASGFALPDFSQASYVVTLLYGAMAARADSDSAAWEALIGGITKVAREKFEDVAKLITDGLYSIPAGQEDILDVARARAGWQGGP